VHVVGVINPLDAKLNPICHLLALLGAHHIFHVSVLRVKEVSDIMLLTNELGQKMPVLIFQVENVFLGSESTQLNKSFYMHT